MTARSAAAAQYTVRPPGDLGNQPRDRAREQDAEQQTGHHASNDSTSLEVRPGPPPREPTLDHPPTRADHQRDEGEQRERVKVAATPIVTAASTKIPTTNRRRGQISPRGTTKASPDGVAHLNQRHQERRRPVPRGSSSRFDEAGAAGVRIGHKDADGHGHQRERARRAASGRRVY